LANGDVYAWGRNNYGQLGQGDTAARATAIKVTLPRPAIAIAAGRDHSLVVLDDGSVCAWGLDDGGQLGIANRAQALSPANVAGISGVARVAAGNAHSLALRTDGSVALIDFGLAKEIAQEDDITGRGEIFGTPFYMSPEQGHGRAVDVRSDLYSLGIIFYEMLTGKKPFQAKTPMGVIYQHTHSPIPQLPLQFHGLQPLLERLLAKLPEQRYQTAAELGAAAAKVASTWQPLATLNDRRRGL
jgi:hypothetical protein